MKFNLKFNKQNLFIIFAYLVVALLLVKACDKDEQTEAERICPKHEAHTPIMAHHAYVDSLLLSKRKEPVLFSANGSPVKNRITSVRSFKKAFPDLNDVQLATARETGIEKCSDREEAALRTGELVYIEDNPYYTVRTLRHSIPYLTPHAANLLNTIARAFIDSLTTKNLPLHKIEVTSVLRTEKDISKLRRINVNASQQSCHRFGTTFDIGYNKFIRISTDGNKEMQHAVALKSVLAEVLEDLRQMEACYVKYERKQACFHITAR